MWKKRAERNARKFRRYGNIYHQARAAKRAKTVLGIVAGVAVAAALAFLGWTAYPSVRDRILNGPEETVPETQAPRLSEEPSASQPSSEAPTLIVVDTPPVAEDKGPSHGVFAPTAAAASAARLEALLAQASAGGVDRVLVDAKGIDGVLLYQSQNEIALEAQAVSPGAYDAQSVAQAIREQGMTPAARVAAFRDPLMSGYRREMAVLYGNTTARWLDNAANNGGKSWLNPCSEEARQYVIDLAVELTQAGFAEIVVDAVQFPSGLSAERASFGMPYGFSRSEALSGFVAALTEQIEAAGGRVTVNLPADCIAEGRDERAAAAVAASNANLYGGDPQAIVGGRAMVTLGASSDQTAIRSFIEKFPGIEWTVCVPSYAMDGDAITAAEAVGVFGPEQAYILYNPSGTYLFE